MTLPKPSKNTLIARVENVHRQSSQGLASRFSRVWNIAKYYRKSQLARRALSLIAKRIGLNSKSVPPTSVDVIVVRVNPGFDTIRQIRASSTERNRCDVRDQLENGRIRVLNLEREIQWRIGNAQSNEQGTASLLWQFQLHYHEYLIPLMAVSPDADQNARDLDLIRQTIESWIDQNAITNADAHLDAWHPYCISRRLPVWFCLLSMNGLDLELREAMERSAFLQAQFLSQNLEWDLRGNHLLENLRALALAGCYFETTQSNAWLSQVRSIIPAQLVEQVLEHGEHFERCPMYHCQILGNLLEMMVASQNVDGELYRQLRPVAEKMFGFLVEVVHPDGEIPLLGDSCFGEAPNVDCLGQLAEELGLEFPTTDASPDCATQAGDYWVYRDQSDYLIFDRGLAGAEALPAHAHCDLLTLESSIRGTRWLVDSGIYNYDDDPMRWYCRSTLAHNVVSVEDQNQFDIWSRFRMGYRGWPSELDQGVDAGFNWATASHNAYRRLGVKKVSRLIGIEPGRFWYCIDRAPMADSNDGKRISGFLHLGPEVEITDSGDANSDETCFRIEFENQSCELIFIDAAQVSHSQSWYCPEFGKRIANWTIEYEFKSGSDISGWMLIPGPNNDRLSLKIERQPQADQIKISNSMDEIIHTFNWKNTQ